MPGGKFCEDAPAAAAAEQHVHHGDQKADQLVVVEPGFAVRAAVTVPVPVRADTRPVPVARLRAAATAASEDVAEAIHVNLKKDAR